MTAGSSPVSAADTVVRFGSRFELDGMPVTLAAVASDRWHPRSVDGDFGWWSVADVLARPGFYPLDRSVPGTVTSDERGGGER